MAAKKPATVKAPTNRPVPVADFDGLVLIRLVTNIVFQDPHVMRIERSYTYQNNGAVHRGVVRFQKSSPEKGFFANLRVRDRDGKDLEILHSGGSETEIRVGPVDIPPGRQRTIQFEYVEVVDTVAPYVLFQESQARLDVPIGPYRHYVYVQPSPRMRLAIGRRQTALPASRTKETHAPVTRNAWAFRIDPIGPEEQVEMAAEVLREQGFTVAVMARGLASRVQVRRPPTRLRWLGLIPPLARRAEKPYLSNAQALVADNSARISVKQKLPRSLKLWFVAVILTALGAGLFNSSVPGAASIVALLAVTRSWLFYEERLMRRIGYVLAFLLLLNIANTASLLAQGDAAKALLRLLF